MSFTGGTTKAQVERAITEVDVLCELAAVTVRSFMPIGLGKKFGREGEELEFLLTEIPMRFKRAIEQAQKKGWAAK